MWLVSMLLGAGYGLTLSTQSHFWEIADYSTTAIAWIGLANGIGILVGYLAAALYADRVSKQRLVRVSAILLAVMSGLVALLELGDLVRGEWFYLIAALFGIAHGLAAAVILGWVGDLLPRRLIAKGVVVLSLASIPLGVLIAVPGPLLREESYATLTLFAIAFVIYLFASACTRHVPIGSMTSQGHETAVRGLRAATRYMWGDVRLRTLWWYLLLVGVLATLLYAALSDYLLLDSDLEPIVHAWSFMARGLATLAATIGLVFVIGGPSRWRILLGAAVVSSITVVLVSFTTQQALVILLFVPQGMAMTVIALGGQALALSVTRAGFFGRVAALLLFAAYLLNFAAGFTRNFLYDWFDGRWSVLAIGLLLLFAAAWLYRQWRGFRHLPEDPEPAVDQREAGVWIAPHLGDHLAPQKPAAPD